MDAMTIRVVRIALDVISERLVTFTALAMTFSLACWVMAAPDMTRAEMAAFFAIFVFIPCIWKERVKHESGTSTPAAAPG